MKEDNLTFEDMLWLKTYALELQDGQDAPLETLARLEHQGLVMRGWNHQHVVTDKGRETIEDAI